MNMKKINLTMIKYLALNMGLLNIRKKAETILITLLMTMIETRKDTLIQKKEAISDNRNTKINPHNIKNNHIRIIISMQKNKFLKNNENTLMRIFIKIIRRHCIILYSNGMILLVSFI